MAPGARVAFLLGLAALSGRGRECRAEPPTAKEAPPPRAVPLPLKGRVTVRSEGRPYFVDGAQTIPKGSAIRIEQDVRVVGVNGASIQVDGGFEVHGTQERWATIENVDFGRTRAPETNFHFDMADLQRCSFAHADGESFEGQVTFENCCLQKGCKFAWRLAGGFLRIMTTDVTVPCRVEVLPTKGKPPEVSLRSSWFSSVSLTGPCNGTVRACELKEGLEARDFTDLVVDGCDVWGSLAFRQGEQGSFSRLVLTKDNLMSGARLVLERPAAKGTTPEKVKVERFFFESGEGFPALDDKAVADRIDDGADREGQSVKAFWSKPASRPHVFVSDTLRMRAPPRR
jgi:hypothetical protein